ncbi:AGAP013214-PA-like protein [Anopheles sinensis]|uniref:AGAP013214-PA-like protein n=1 Tax=Anopheles sinensis TaxID=74873 RepID=A0A084VS36_ANOSI|nr:AGAP013214-PA-like protein [Anopheles sinensis]
MAKANITKLMMEFLYRNVLTEPEEQIKQADQFVVAKSQTEVINMLGFIMGYVDKDLDDLGKFESKDLLDEKARKMLLPIVERMPSFEFMIIPLVLVREAEGISLVPLLRVRKQTTGSVSYLDLCLRLYDNFPKFLESNRMPPCELWFPTDGVIRFNEDHQLLVSSTTIKRRTAEILKPIATIGGAAATGLLMTPITSVVAIPLVILANVPMLGFQIADLVDGCKHERGTVVFGRSAALVVNLVAFSSVGLTAACEAATLRNMLSPGKLLLLQKADAFMKATAKVTSTVNTVYSIISCVNGWQQLDGSEWVAVATSLCLAFRTVITTANATALFELLQKHGVERFFTTYCANVARDTVRSKLEDWFPGLLDLACKILPSLGLGDVKFSVDDQFITLRLFGYEFKFEKLFKLHTAEILKLLNYVRSFVDPIKKICSLKNGAFTQEVLDGLMTLMALVTKLQSEPCELGKYITIGKGHLFTFDTLLAWWNAPTHNRQELLRALLELDKEETKQLNEIRSTRLGPDGDTIFFRWLIGRHPDCFPHYLRALRFLLGMAERTANRPIVFDGSHIVYNHLLSLDTDDWHSIGTNSEAHRPPLALAEALDYALSHELPTVGTVYYSVLFAWSVLTEEVENRGPHDWAAIMARFCQLQCDASALKMDQTMSLQYTHTETLYFGSRERAACWLNLLPALRHKAGREQFNSTVRYLLKKGEAKVLLNEDDGTGAGKEKGTHCVMFYSGRTRIVLELIPLHYAYDDTWLASIQLCSFSFKFRTNGSTSVSND